MADTAHYQTDLKLEEMEKRLSAIYSRAEKEIQKTADEYFSKFAKQDEAKRKLLEQGKITEDEYTKWRKGKVMYGKRFAEMKEKCTKQLLNVNKTAIAYINGELPEVYAINYNALESAVDGVGGYSFTLVDADTVRNLAVTDTSLLPYKEIDPAKDIPWNMKKINAETLQGILQGESMDKIAKRIMNVQEMNKTQAIRSARTIVTGAECKGRQDSYKRAQYDGIILRKYWLATYDKRARDWHKEAGNKYNEDNAIEIDDFFVVDGEDMLHPGDGSHGASGHNLYNCRCSISSKVVGFKKAQVQKAMAEKNEKEQKNESLADARKVYGKADGQKYNVVDGNNVELYATGRERNKDGTWSEIKRYNLGSVKIPENDNPELLVVTGLPDKTKFGQFDDTPNYILSDGRIALNPRAKNNNTRQQISSCVENEIYVLSGARRDGHFYRVIGSDKEIEYIKKGTIRKSINHMTGEMEDGLSVWEIPKYGGGKIVELTGDVISIGSDGEPLLDVSTVKFVRVVDNDKEMRDIGIEKFKKQYNWTDEQYNQAMHGGYKLNR